jgi:hypothetical protein
MLHFGRRGRENLVSLTRKDFAVQQNYSLYIKRQVKKTKTTKMDGEKSSDGRMYEVKGHS